MSQAAQGSHVLRVCLADANLCAPWGFKSCLRHRKILRRYAAQAGREGADYLDVRGFETFPTGNE